MPPITPPETPAHSTDTVLLVEDQEDVRQVLQEGLEDLGYIVLTASNGADALRMCDKEVTIDVVVTDVAMPEMSGPELGERLAVQYPEMTTVYMSGYQDNVTGTLGVLDSGLELLRKPFAADVLARKIREVLHARETPSRQIEIDTRRGLILMRPVGDVGNRDVLESAAAVLQHALYDPTFDSLIDLRGVRLGLSPREVEALADALQASDVTPRRTAVLVDSPRETALVLVYRQRATFHTTQAFSTEEAAYRWLGRIRSAAKT